MQTLRSWSRRAWLLHGYLITALALTPAVSVRSGWVDMDYDETGDSWNDPATSANYSMGELDALSVDIDGDGAYNSEELAYGSDPFDFDSDDDGLNDGDEIHLANEQAQRGYSLLLWDSNGDGVSDHDDFYGYSGVTYPGGVLPGFSNATYSDYDGDGIKNPFDPYPTDPANNDSDGDGIEDPSDPDPAYSNNYSSYNGVDWYGAALEDADNDGISNFWDSSPYDQGNGSNDSDNDGIDNNFDPFPDDNSNYSPTNGTYWYGNVLGDDDWDGTSNYCDEWPYDSSNGSGGTGSGDPNDNDSDGIENGLDPAPDDYGNYSYINGTTWQSYPLEDADNDGTPNFYDSYPYDPYDNNADIDGDGVANGDDPYPADSTNYSSANGISWYGNVLGDDDADGTANWMDPAPGDPYDGNTDIDGDGIENSSDPCPTDPTNYSPFNGLAWGGNALGDDDFDGTINWQDYDPYYTGTPTNLDNDGDGIDDSQDPAPGDGTNYSSYNTVYWNGDALADADYDGVANFWDEWPYDSTNGAMTVSDSDSDGINDSEDPAPGDYGNYSPNNGISWYGDVFGDADGDGTNNFNDSTPYGDGTDGDGDGILDLNDPAPNDASNFSSYNSIAWYSDVLGDADYDGTINFYDLHPYGDNNVDADSDGILDSNDPAPNDASNYSMANGQYWYGDALGDADGDGTANFYDEYPVGAPPTDEDQDGLDSSQESVHGTSDTDPDSDDDGLTDYEEVSIFGSSPTNVYSLSQGRGWGDLYTDWQLADVTDADGDGIPGRIEQHYSLNPDWAGDAALDRDNNGLSNLAQYQMGIALDADLQRYDADDDGMSDVFEDYYSAVLSKNNASDAVLDPDGDGVLNFEEMQLVLSPQSADTWQTGSPLGDLLILMGSVRYPGATPPTTDATPANDIPDWADAVKAAPAAPDYAHFTRQIAADLDGDGMPDEWEHKHGRWKYANGGLDLRRATDAGADPDQDGLTNLTEYRFGTNPLAPQTQTGINDRARFNQHGTTTTTTIPGGGGLMSRYRAQMNTEYYSGNGQFGLGVMDIAVPGNNGGDPNKVSMQVRLVKYFENGDPVPAIDEELDWTEGAYVRAESEAKLENDEVRCGCGCLGTYGDPRGCTGTQEDCGCGYTQSEYGWTWVESSSLEWQCNCGLGHTSAEGCTDGYPETINTSDWGIGIVSSQWIGTCDCQARSWKTQKAYFKVSLAEPATEDCTYYVKVQKSDGTLRLDTLVIPQGSTGCTPVQIVEKAPSGGWVTLSLAQPAGSGDDAHPLTFSASDGAGTRYRKVSLNGMPMPDSKPQVQDESGEAPEETYIDACTRQLHHSVTDVFSTDASTLLPLSVRRDSTSDSWSMSSGLRPGEMPDKPFGLGWSSNVCSYVHFVETSDNVIKSAQVVDEQGCGRRFLSNKEQGGGLWLHSTEETASVATSGDAFTGMVLTKKFGTTCMYEMTNITHVISTDRIQGSKNVVTHTYARLTRVQDRLGNSLCYEYDGDTLIPNRIYDPDRPGREIVISHDGRQVLAVRGPGGEEVSYLYADDRLFKVSRDETAVQYLYHTPVEEDTEAVARGEVPSPMNHVELSSITDELGREYQFTYVFNHDFKTHIYSPQGVDVRTQLGLPMTVASVVLPPRDSSSLPADRTVTFSGARAIIGQDDPTVVAAPGSFASSTASTLVSGPAGSFTYGFGGTSSQTAGFFGALCIDEDIFSVNSVITYSSMSITSAAGTEYYTFGGPKFALTETIDLSGNKTTFGYIAGCDDPVSETSEPVGTNATGYTKSFTYDPDTSLMTRMTDAAGTVTQYTIESRSIGGQMIRGLKTKEQVKAPDGTVMRETRFSYDHPVFHGMVTKEWHISGDEGVMPSSVTQYTLGSETDGGGFNPGWWAEVTQTSGPATAAGELEEALSSTTTISDLAGRKRTVIDARGLLTNFDYDGSGRLAAVTHPDGSQKLLEYDAHGNLVKETNENGVAAFHAYDHLNRRIQTTLDLNGNGVADGAYTTADLTGAEPVYDGDIVTTTAYNARNQVLSQTDARGTTTAHTYDAAGRLIKTAVGELETHFYYDGVNNGGSVFDISGIKPNRTTDPRGVVTTVVYDELYRPVSSTVAAPGITAVTLTEYDALGRPVKVTDPLNRVTLNTYDALGQLIKVTEPDLTADTTDNPTVQTFYTLHGKPWKVIDQNGAVTTTEYDALGRAVKVTAPAVNGVSATVATEYDAAGNAIRVTDALGRETETVYDVRGRPVQVTAPTVWDGAGGQFVRPATTTTYDALGQVLTVTDPMGAATTTHYDNAGRRWKVEAPAPEAGGARPTTVTAFDAGGLALTVANPLGQTVTNTYDTHGRLITTVDAEGITNSFGYDAAGNRTSVTDGKNQTTTFEYDGLNRLIRQTFANGDEWTHQYNAVQKGSQTSPRGIVTSYSYDARDRLVGVSAPAHDGAPALSRAYTYDKAGRLLTVTEAGNAAASVSYDYDALGRVTAESSRGQVHQYAYDLAGNRIKASYSTGRVVETSYDGLNRPEVISEGGRATRYGYDLAGRAVVLVAGNGQTSVNTYDALGRLQDRTLFRTSAMTEAEVQAEFSWEHDALGNVLAQHETWPGETTRQGGIRSTVMAYDANNRLIEETIQTRANPTATPTDQSSTAYTYDAANNRASKTVTRIAAAASSAEAGENEAGHWAYTYNSANQLTAWEKWDEPNGSLQKNATLSYDDAGNRTGQTVDHISTSATDEVTSYTWDAQDRLLGVTLPGGSQHSYDYDYRTRRIGTRSTTTGTTPVTKQTAIVFSGGLSVAEWESENGEPGTANPPTVEYTRGPDMGGGVGGLLYSLRSESSGSGSSPSALSATPRYNLSNGRGDIVAQSNQSAALTWTASYEAYGKRTKETGENQDKQRGNSKDEDPTGLLNEGFRYRDLETGVWLSRDPAGFVDGPNLYAYVTQNPWTAFDPDGLEKRHKDNPSNEDIGVAIDSLRKQGDQQAAAHKAELAKQCFRCHPVGENDIGESARASYRQAKFLERILKVRGKVGEDGYGEMQAGLELSKEFGNEVNDTHREFFRGETGFMTSSRQRATFGWITGLAQASINSSVMFALTGGFANTQSSTSLAVRNGSGPQAGFLEVSNSYKSVGAVKNFQGKSTDFLFDTQMRRFVMGNNPSGHCGIAKVMRVGESQQGRLVGGTIYQRNGVLMTNEHSGHFGHLWNEATRSQFSNFMQAMGVEAKHSAIWVK